MVNPPTGTSGSYWRDVNTYIGYYEAFNPDHLSADGWTISSWRLMAGLGVYGGCPNCRMIEVIWIRMTTIIEITSVIGALRADGTTYDVQWYQNIAGNVKILDNGVIKNQGAYQAGQNWNTIPGLSPGPHEICVVGV